MSFALRPSTLTEYANFHEQLGSRIVSVGDMHWRRVRTCFFRPLVLTESYEPGRIGVPASSLFGGVQHAVPDHSFSNSTINLIVSGNAGDYSFGDLDYNRRRQIRLAGRHFEIKPVKDAGEFVRDAYPAYCSFYQRTRYDYGSQRRDPAYFARWARKLFEQSNVMIQGAYKQGTLHAVSLSLWVEDTLSYATFFSNEEALRQNVSDLMLHAVRQAAAACPGIKQVYAGTYKGGEGVDQFYLLRGFRVVKKRALLRINPLAKLLLSAVAPKQISLLQGETAPGM